MRANPAMNDWSVVWERRDRGDFAGAMESLYVLMCDESLGWLRQRMYWTHEEPHDVLHTAFIAVWNKLGAGAIAKRASLRPYAVSTVRYIAYERRSRGRATRSQLDEKDLSDDRKNPERLAYEAQALRRLVRELRLSPQRELLTRALSGQPPGAVCQAMGITATKYRNAHHRAMRRLIEKAAA